jgi:hypothetical protein
LAGCFAKRLQFCLDIDHEVDLGQLLLQPLLLLGEADDVRLTEIGLSWACIQGWPAGDATELGGDSLAVSSHRFSVLTGI